MARITGCLTPSGPPHCPHVPERPPRRRGDPVRRAATVLLTAALTSAGLAAITPPAAAAGDIQPIDLTITVKDLGPEGRTCKIDADLYVPAGVSKANRKAVHLAVDAGCQVRCRVGRVTAGRATELR